MQTWSLWYPKAASTGLLHARAAIDPVQTVLVHAAPEYLTVEIHDEDGTRIAFGQDLPRTQESPMTRLTRDGDRITREDVWPTDDDLETQVLLPGGEAGALKSWWNADDHKQWRWQLEFYNSLR